MGILTFNINKNEKVFKVWRYFIFIILQNARHFEELQWFHRFGWKNRIILKLRGYLCGNNKRFDKMTALDIETCQSLDAFWFGFGYLFCNYIMNLELEFSNYSFILWSVVFLKSIYLTTQRIARIYMLHC